MAFAPVELAFGGEVSCFGEYSRAVPATDALCVVLHDRAKDLDSLRWLALDLLAFGISQLLIDLPGHGLSGGTTGAPLGPVIEAAAEFASSKGYRYLTFVAEGASAHAVLRTKTSSPPLAAALVAPIAEIARRAPQGRCWEGVPKLAFVPKNDEACGEFADALLRRTHSWCLLASLTFSDDTEPISEAARVQMASITAKFFLEQIAYADAANSEPGRIPERISTPERIDG